MTVRIAITCGDMAGVGPDVIEAWLAGELAAGRDVSAVTVIGPARWLDCLSQLIAESAVSTVPVLSTVAVGDAAWQREAGVPSGESAEMAWLALQEAARGCREGRYDAVVTGPVSKGALVQRGYAFVGQTEFFAEAWGGVPTMAFAGGQMRVALATWHIPLAQVASALTEAVLRRAVERMVSLLQSLGVCQPRIAVCGLNPHAGEGGILGREEVERINPWLRSWQREFPGLSEALPADTVFWRHLRGDFDGVVALYHDQGLAPLKTVEFDEAVNITLGLPWVRTSPDHGTAFALAGKAGVSCQSFTRAVQLACLLGGQSGRLGLS